MNAPSGLSPGYRLTDKELYLEIKVHAASRRNQVGPVTAGRIRVSVTIAPEKGKANKEVVKLISEWAGVDASSVSVASGLANPRKTLAFSSSDPKGLLARILKNLLPSADR